ncbi:putative 2-oxoglutarate ferredoxin oxidoreductase subunit alpha [Candidatus Uzinura diaspidicola str. ASNER]|uniref:Putative 2-oxoglutarate ferredoxin oxidoreductase subunit alpha n=1 Tax=Candidatus Uzinura diaspidicola str. ASNER TaxID=1133592 RepID=L7VJF5_9FLAO|nr:putative 2-oxoglutarate ferredoxin oxidoreductase subunit alpha [Candidatus Uzinura diaspidicola str. ASNER]
MKKLSKTFEPLEEITILFAGDSGDGMQLVGSQFTKTSSFIGNDVSTFTEFPAEIRAPTGFLSGISGFQINFGSVEISFPGDCYDVLVVLNASALKKIYSIFKKKGIIIINTSGFSLNNLKKAGYQDSFNLLKEISAYTLYPIDILMHTENTNIGKYKNITKNMFALGFVYWLFKRTLVYTECFLKKNLKKNPTLLKANLIVLRAGFNFGKKSSTKILKIKSAIFPSGNYRNIKGNQAIVLGLSAASVQAQIGLFYAGYPITPASDILHHFSKYKNLGVKSFQAEDEIAAITSAIGASFAGSLGVSGTSGPGMALKQEGIGLAFMLELPLVIINVQRGGPSTGLPTKIEQSDLFQSIYGRNGETPMPVLAPHSPSHAFEMAFQAAKISIEHMTPVILLSDIYIANGSEIWRFPNLSQLDSIYPPFANKKNFLPYERNERAVRNWGFPGMAFSEHCIGGLEKENKTGNVSYDPKNHEKMISLRKIKMDFIQDRLPLQTIDSGVRPGKILLLSWGSTYGIIRGTMKTLIKEKKRVAHSHIDYLSPLPQGLETLFQDYKKVIVFELNGGQLIHIIRDKFLVDVVSFYKIQGRPFTTSEIITEVYRLLTIT